MTKEKDEWLKVNPDEPDMDKMNDQLNIGLERMKEIIRNLEIELQRLQSLKDKGEDVEEEMNIVRAGIKVAGDNVRKSLRLLEQNEAVKRMLEESTKGQSIN